MRILWFINSKGKANKYYNKKHVKGGWIISLQEAIEQISGIELGIAFYHDKDDEPFIFEGTKYFPVRNILEKNKFIEVANKHFSKIEHKQNLKKYIKIVDEFNPDVIHIHGTENPFGLISEYIKVPIVISIQGNLTVYAHKFYSGLPSAKVLFRNSVRSFLSGNSSIHKYSVIKKRSNLEKEIFRKNKYFIGRTDWDKNISKALSPNREYFHCDETLRDEFYNKTWKSIPNNKNIKLITTTGPNIYKGLETIFETASILKENNFQFEWNVIGVKNNDNILSICKKLYSQKPKDLNINILGIKDAEYLSKILAQSHLYIQVSHIENSPNSICEAMLVGTPVIASNVGGTSSLIQQNISGLLYQDGDPYNLAGMIQNYWSNLEKVISYATNAKAIAKKRHNKETIVSDLIKIYKNLC